MPIRRHTICILSFTVIENLPHQCVSMLFLSQKTYDLTILSSSSESVYLHGRYSALLLAAFSKDSSSMKYTSITDVGNK